MIRTFLLVAALAGAAPVAAQDAVPADLAERLKEARAAEATAQLMIDMQEAISAAQRQYIGMVGASAFGDGFRGAVAYPLQDSDAWRVVLVTASGEGPQADLHMLAEYDVAQGQIRAETLYDGGEAAALTGIALQMARAKYVAPRAVIAASGVGYCLDGEPASQGSPRSVSYIPLVLPPDENGAIDAYVLNGPIAAGSLPLGKHYRVHFDAFGQVGDPEIVTDTCEVITWQPDQENLASSVYLTELEKGAAPSAIHAFISASLPMRLGVVTGDIIWPIANGTIAAPVPAGD
jgi:hypothetical protein